MNINWVQPGAAANVQHFFVGEKVTNCWIAGFGYLLFCADPFEGGTWLRIEQND